MALYSSSVIRFVTKTGMVQLQLKVKPGVSRTQQGITAIEEQYIELGVASQPRDGSANKEAIEVLSRILEIPKTRIELVRGAKSREKTFAVKESNADLPLPILERLRASIAK